MPTAMTLDSFVQNAYLIATGKATGLTFGATKYTKLVDLANIYTQIWANQSDVNWRSLRTSFAIGTVTATNTFTIPSTVGQVSEQEGDFVRIANTDGITESDYSIVPVERLYDDGPIVGSYGPNETANSKGVCAVVGKSLVFNRAFLSTDLEFGGAMTIPGYSIPATLVNTSDSIVVDDPYWLVFRCAAEYVRNDVTRVQLYPSLIDQANDRLEAMKSTNESQVETVYTGGWRPLGQTWI